MSKANNNLNGVLSVSFPEITDPKKRAFLAAFAEVGTIGRAAEAAKVCPKSAWNWRQDQGESGKVFRAAFAVAERLAGDSLEFEARRRAVDGL